MPSEFASARRGYIFPYIPPLVTIEQRAMKRKIVWMDALATNIGVTVQQSLQNLQAPQACFGKIWGNVLIETFTLLLNFPICRKLRQKMDIFTKFQVKFNKFGETQEETLYLCTFVTFFMIFMIFMIPNLRVIENIFTWR